MVKTEEKTYTVDRICSWCGMKLGKKSGMRTPIETHGVCEDCRKACEMVSIHAPVFVKDIRMAGMVTGLDKQRRVLITLNGTSTMISRAIDDVRILAP